MGRDSFASFWLYLAEAEPILCKTKNARIVEAILTVYFSLRQNINIWGEHPASKVAILGI